jgi:ankyrin repeat protein
MIHAKDDGNTVLHFACRVGNVFLIRRLLRHGEDINARNTAGQTALDIASNIRRARSSWNCCGTGRSDER